MVLCTKEITKFSYPIDVREWGRRAEMLEPGKTGEILGNFESGLPAELIECFFSRRVWKVSVEGGSCQKQVRQGPCVLIVAWNIV